MPKYYNFGCVNIVVCSMIMIAANGPFYKEVQFAFIWKINVGTLDGIIAQSNSRLMAL